MLSPLAPDVWSAHQPMKALGFQLGTKMTVMRATDGRLAVFSPIAPTVELLDAVRALGEIGWLVAPSKMHHLFLPAWADAFPDAQVRAPPTLRAKQKSLRIDVALGSPTDGVWADSFEEVFLAGMPVADETVFLHKPSRTLVVTDLLFHLEPQDWWTDTYLKLSGILGKPGSTMLIRSSVKDRPAFRASVERLLCLDFDRVQIPHGSPLLEDAKDRMKEALTWATRS